VANADRFRNEAALAKLVADWPAARLVEIWNSLPGVTPVAKFKDRKTAASRIWKAIQTLGSTTAEAPETAAEAVEPNTAPEPVAEAEPGVAAEPETPFDPEAAATQDAPQTPDVAPAEVPAQKKATRAKKTPTEPTGAKAPREASKTSQVIAMLKREGGTTLEEIMTAMGWQKHTTRAMLSAGGSLTKKHGLVVTSEKVGEKRVYTIKG
jgi:hypothetical protein